MRAHVIAFIAFPLIAAIATAQRPGVELGRAGVVAPPRYETPSLSRGWGAAAAALDTGRVRSFAPLASLIVPGSGQLLLREDRFLAYLAVEALAWWKYTKDVRDRAAQERNYKELALNIARAPFASAVKGPLPDSGWLYYEWMKDKSESGRYSMASSGPVVPETNVSTYNGERWALAKSTNANYTDQLAQYEREAIKPEYQWSWLNAQLQWDIYKRTIDKRNDAAHAAVQDLIVISVNHVLSMVDAFAMIRLQAPPDQRGRTGLGASVRW